MLSKKGNMNFGRLISSVASVAVWGSLALLTEMGISGKAFAQSDLGCDSPLCEDLDRSVGDAFQTISDLRGWSMKGYLATTSGVRLDGTKFFQANIFVTDKNLPAKVVIERGGQPQAECQLVYGKAKRDFKGTYYSAQVVMNEGDDDTNIGSCDLDLATAGVQPGVITAEPGDFAIVYFQTGGKYLPFYVAEYYNYRFILQNDSKEWFQPNPLANKPSAGLRAAVRRLQREADVGLKAVKTAASKSRKKTATRRR